MSFRNLRGDCLVLERELAQADTVRRVEALINQNAFHDKVYYLVVYEQGGSFHAKGLYGRNGARLSFIPLFQNGSLQEADKACSRQLTAKLKKGYSSDRNAADDILKNLQGITGTPKKTVAKDSDAVKYVDKILAQM